MNLLIGAVYCAGACALIRSKSFHRPAAGEALFRAEKGRKRLAPDLTPVRRHASPVPCASRRMRAGTNSGIHGLKQWRSEEHTSELQSLMRISYAVFCLQ